MKCFCRYLCCCFSPQTTKTSKEEKNSEELQEKLISDKSRASRNKSKIENGPDTKDSSSDEKKENSIFDFKYYLDEEITNVLYTKSNLISIINKEFTQNDSKYKEFFNKDNMVLSSRDDGSVVTSNIPMIRMVYWLPKSNFPSGTTIQKLADYMNDPVKRLKWDTSMKKVEIVENKEKGCLLHSWMNKPVFFISERDLIEKKFDFESSGSSYTFSSSIKDELYKKIDNVERITNFFSSMKISEDKDKFYFRTLNQIDYKMKTPMSLLGVTLPMKLKEWYKNLTNIINEDAKKSK